MSEIDERERWQSYATIRTLSDELLRWAEMRGNPPTALVSEKIIELMSGVAGLAGFSTRQSSEYLQEALTAISKLGHPNLFGRVEE
jgi:hypothetical protein